MNYLRRLWRIEILTLVSLLIYSVCVGLYFVIRNSLRTEPDMHAFDVALHGAAWTLYVGWVPATLLGAPVYSAFATYRRISLTTVLFVAILPGCLPFIFGVGMWHLATLGIVGGLTIALMVHLLSMRWTGIHGAA